MNLVIKDALRQIIWRVASALGWFIVIKLITPYLWPLRFGDYSTILKYFAIWSAFADFGIYVIALKQLWKIKAEAWNDSEALHTTYNRFVSTRMCMIICVYTAALLIAYFIPAYTQNPYLVRWLPLWMLFSASFMTAWILQVPLQLFWKMEQLSIALVLARVVQIWVLIFWIYVAYAWVDFSIWTHIPPFLLIIFSVLASGIVQAIYVRWTWRKYLNLKREFDRAFTKRILSANWQYGLAYYLSSFHTLLVLMLLSWMFPTVEWFTYVWVWALALSLIEILLVVPSALGNSLIHKVSWEDVVTVRKRYGWLLELVFRIGCYVIVMFTFFAPHIILFIGWESFLSTSTTIWSEFILPFLAIVLALSFIKQVFNYIFVTTWYQNTLLRINLVWVIIGVSLAIPLILHHQLLWWIVAQIVLEVLFVVGSLFVARKHKVLPIIHRRPNSIVLLITALLVIFVPTSVFVGSQNTVRLRLVQGFLCTMLVTWVSFHYLKTLARKL